LNRREEDLWGAHLHLSVELKRGSLIILEFKQLIIHAFQQTLLIVRGIILVQNKTFEFLQASLSRFQPNRPNRRYHNIVRVLFIQMILASILEVTSESPRATLLGTILEIQRSR